MIAAERERTWIDGVPWPEKTVSVVAYDSGANVLGIYGQDPTVASHHNTVENIVDPFDDDKRHFETGAVRDVIDGKGRYDLLPTRATRLLAKHFQTGAAKYGDNNWRKGIPVSVYIDSAKRHLDKWAEGHTDERHDVAAAWNMMALIETIELVKEGKLPQSLINMPY